MHKYLLAIIFRGGNLDPKIATWIQKVTTTFWNAYLKQDESEKNKLQSGELMEDTGEELVIKSK
jgi:hypothetical protein